MEKKLSIQNRDGNSLSAVLHTPSRHVEKIMVFTHSFKGDKEYDRIIRNTCIRLASNGCAALRYDCCGSGGSDGRFEDASVTTELADLQDVVDFVRSKGYSRIGLAGLSLGAFVSVMACDTSTKCLVLWSIPFRLTGFHNRYRAEIEKQEYIVRKRLRTGERIRVGKPMWEDFGKIDIYDALPKITCPVLVVYGSEDSLPAFKWTKKYFENIAAEKEMKIIQGADHDFLDIASEEKAISVSVDWIMKHL